MADESRKIVRKITKATGISLTDAYFKKLSLIREYLGTTSNSETIRRLVDHFIEEKGISTPAGAESDNPSFSSEVN